MKTNQELIRQIGDLEVVQRTSDEYFDANVLLRAWNREEGNARKQMDRYLGSPSTKELISTLHIELLSQCDEDTSPDCQPVVQTKGRNTKKGKTYDKTWMHPLIFIDFAMWLNPSFKMQVLKFISDHLVFNRVKAGDLHKKLTTAVCYLRGNESFRQRMQEVSVAMNYIIFGQHYQDIRNKFGDSSKMDELTELIDKVIYAIQSKFIVTYQQLIDHLSMLCSNKFKYINIRQKLISFNKYH